MGLSAAIGCVGMAGHSAKGGAESVVEITWLQFYKLCVCKIRFKVIKKEKVGQKCPSLLSLQLPCSHKLSVVLVQGEFDHMGEFGRKLDLIP